MQNQGLPSQLGVRPAPELANTFLVQSFGWMFAGLLLTALALFANRFYPLCLASFQWLAITSHLVRDLNSEILPLAYALMMVVPSYMQQLVLTIGIAAHRRREKLHGPYRSWRTYWRGSRKTGRTSSTG